MKDRRPGKSRRTFWMDDDLYVEIQKLAKSENCSMTHLVDRALRGRLQEEEIQRTDRALGPVVDRVLQERLRRTEAGLRALMVATLHEVLRTQYVILNSAVEPGASAETVNRWREDGWEFATRQVKEHRDWVRKVLERED